MTGGDSSEYAERDPTGRYGRYSEVLGRGASKIVYKAFDEYLGLEVAWNQVKLQDFLQSQADMERLCCEIHLLKTLRHRHIMRFHTSWVDIDRRNINFITEMFTSGTLRQYRQRHRRVSMLAVKHWCRQILSGLQYLHSHDPPIIHRDLKCDNIFVNGHQGEVKIGDLGLAAILRKSLAVHCVGTPEFMAPEVYMEEYNELVDIYSFGMCVLEMVSFEYPYSECSSPVEIYKRVMSGTKPEALYKVKDAAVRQFIEKCLASASVRLSAEELLQEPFLQSDDGCCYTVERDAFHCDSSASGDSECIDEEVAPENGSGYDYEEMRNNGIDLFNEHEEDQSLGDVDITIKGKRVEDGTIFLQLRIIDDAGNKRFIHFQFDVDSDTALSVATEMKLELDITDHEVTRIAEMIDGEVVALVPNWKPGPSLLEGCEDIAPAESSMVYCQNCGSTVSSNDSLSDFLASANEVCRCAETHGRFEEVTFEAEHSSKRCASEEADLVESNTEDTALGSEAIQVNGFAPSNCLGSCSSFSELHELPRMKEKHHGNAAGSLKTRRPASLKRVLHQSIDFDNMSLCSGKVSPAPPSRPSLVLCGKMESFHFSKNNSYRIPEYGTAEEASTSSSENGIVPPRLTVHRPLQIDTTVLKSIPAPPTR